MNTSTSHNSSPASADQNIQSLPASAVASSSPAPSFNEPWRVRPYHLKEDPNLAVGDDGEVWAFQDWDILGSDSEHRIAQVGFSQNSSDWGCVSSRKQAIANRDRIIACVNACAGMEDPAAEIAKLRAAAGVTTPTFES